MIEQFQSMDSATANTLAVQSYGLDQGHKHLPEMTQFSGKVEPIFVPTVANYDQGMLDSGTLVLQRVERRNTHTSS